MSSLLSVHDFRFEAKGPTITFSLSVGQLMVIYGPAGSGKTRFIRCLCGLERGYKGSIRLGSEVALAGYPAPSKRSIPENVARKASGRSGAGRVAEALGATHLWESRRTAFGVLSEGAQAATELLTVLSSPAGLAIIDGQLEALDPWTRSSVLELIHHRLSQGQSVIISSSLPELAPRSDLLLIWKKGKQAFIGSYDELERSQKWLHMEIETLHDETVRALCAPFEVSIVGGEGRTQVKARDGQALAARMLLEGYGDVRAVIQRPLTPEEVLSLA